MRALTIVMLAAPVALCSAFVGVSLPAVQRPRCSLSMAAEERSQTTTAQSLRRIAGAFLATATLVAGATLMPVPAEAVSGGGMDYSGLNISGQDFSKGKYKEKDFSGCIAKETIFKGSDLRGARFFKADLDQADFTGANLAAASLEGANMEGTTLKDAVLEGTYFSQTLEGVKDITGADFTEASMRKDVQRLMCKRPDATGTNPTTGVDTRDSLLCDL
eukprot:TRINITY_DN22855_c0_g1_i1.p1 TRINITY_DN22855_c0_g1~~TRINITY_DN22855_c0_g1_i1.p1  ORF type:complete len:218 (+),score=52.78 TRINITY_DN22855_c0_g1_i1:1030-1683(+)